MSLWRRVSRVVLLGLVLPLSGAFSVRAAPDENGWFEAQADQTTSAPEVGASRAPESVEPGSVPAEPEPAPPAQEPDDSRDDRDARALSDFRPTLDPYGTWVNHPTYGTVWVPRGDVVGADFAPYVSAGHWALDVDGNWVWVSDYPFGGVVFHYGRWVWIGGSGWAWIPGFRYAPAWVTWRVPTSSYAYVGWAPLGPDYVWFNGVAVSFSLGLPIPWVFCPSVNVFHRHVHHYVVRDRVVIARAAANTRRYTPSYSVRGRAVIRHSGPSLVSARVPAHAVPYERVRVRSLQANRRYAAPSVPERRSSAHLPRSSAPMRSVGPSRAVPGRHGPDRSYSAPERRVQPRPSEPIRRIQPSPQPQRVPPRSQPAPRVEPRRYQPSPGSQVAPRFEPAPRRMDPGRSPSPAPRTLAPSQPAPRRVEPMRSVPRMSPAPRMSPSPRMSPGPRMSPPGGGGRRH